MEWKTPFFEANASARPRIIQFTVISERNSPKLSYRAGIYPFKINSISVTKLAITTIKQGSLTALGITFFSRDITALEQISTKVVARPMPMPFEAIVVTASVGHIPSRVTSVGFSFMRPLVSS